MKEKIRVKDSRENDLEDLFKLTLQEDRIVEDIKKDGLDKKALAKKAKQHLKDLAKIQEDKKPFIEKLR